MKTTYLEVTTGKGLRAGGEGIDLRGRSGVEYPGATAPRGIFNSGREDEFIPPSLFSAMF